VTTLASTSRRRCRSRDAVALCRLCGGGSFGPARQDDAMAGARTPVLRADCWRTSITECSCTWAAA